MRLRPFVLPALFLTIPLSISPTASLLAQSSRSARSEAPLTSPIERASLHNGPEWETIAPHLPDPKLASAATLETAADVLRARRFPEDALDYYGYAMARGGNVSNLLNKMGVVRLELRQTDLAHEMFQRTVRVQKRNAAAWNNLGVTEYTVKNFRAAISDYKQASKIDKTSAVYHSNLAMAYFESRDMESARKEFAIALKIDPSIMHGGDSGGITAHIVGSENYGELCIEMARLYARQARFADAILWLGKSAESGYNVRDAMRGDSALYPLLKNPELLIMLTNAEGLRSGRSIAAANAPSLGAAPEPEKPAHFN